MSEPFALDETRVLVRVWIHGPVGVNRNLFAVDTGSNRTIIRPGVLAVVGIDASATAPRGRLRSSTGGARAGTVVVPRLKALGRERFDFPVVAHDFPPALPVDGVLGLDFFRGLVLTVDFAAGRVLLRPPRAWWHFWL